MLESSTMFIEASCPVEITKYLVKQCGGKSGAYRYLFHDKIDNRLKVQTVMVGQKGGSKKLYVHQFKPETVLKNNAEIIPTDYDETLQQVPQEGGAAMVAPFMPTFLPRPMPIAPVGVFPSGIPLFRPFGMGPFFNTFAVLNPGKIHKFQIDNITCGSACFGLVPAPKTTLNAFRANPAYANLNSAIKTNATNDVILNNFKTAVTTLTTRRRPINANNIWIEFRRTNPTNSIVTAYNAIARPALPVRPNDLMHIYMAEVVTHKVKEAFKNRYDSTNVDFDKVVDVNVDPNDATKWTATVDYTKTVFPFGPRTLHKSKRDRITEIRNKVNAALA